MCALHPALWGYAGASGFFHFAGGPGFDFKRMYRNRRRRADVRRYVGTVCVWKQPICQRCARRSEASTKDLGCAQAGWRHLYGAGAVLFRGFAWLAARPVWYLLDAYRAGARVRLTSKEAARPVFPGQAGLPEYVADYGGQAIALILQHKKRARPCIRTRPS